MVRVESDREQLNTENTLRAASLFGNQGKKKKEKYRRVYSGVQKKKKTKKLVMRVKGTRRGGWVTSERINDRRKENNR